MLLGGGNTECFERSVPFVQIYDQQTLDQTLYFNENVQVDVTMGYFDNISAVQWLFDSSTNEKSSEQFAIVLRFTYSDEISE